MMWWGRTGDVKAVGCCACSLGKGDLHCPSIEPVTNTSAMGLCLLLLRKQTTHESCDSQSCNSSPGKKSSTCRMKTPQLTGHVFLILGPTAELSSWLWWAFSHETETLCWTTYCFTGSNFGSLRLHKHLKTPRGPAHHHTEWVGRRHLETPPNSWALQDEPPLEWRDGREIEAERFEHYEERRI